MFSLVRTIVIFFSVLKYKSLVQLWERAVTNDRDNRRSSNCKCQYQNMLKLAYRAKGQGPTGRQYVSMSE